MARKVETIVTLTDDLDGTKAERTVSFSYDGTAYEIDLSKKNVAALDKLLAPYVGAARRATRATRGRAKAGAAKRPASGRSDLSAVREWATANGITVSQRGRIAQTVQDAYDAAH